MSSRLVQATCKWQRLCYVAQRFYYKQNVTICGYATASAPKDIPQLPTDNFNGQLNKWISVQKCIKSSYSTAAYAERPSKVPPMTALMDKLLTHHQRFGQLNFELCEKIITQLETNPNVYNQLLEVDNAHFLLGACGTQMPSRTPKVRLNMFERLWTYMAHHSQLNATDYITRLHVLKHNRATLADFRVFLEEFNKLNSGNEYALSDIFVELLETLCEAGDMKQTTELLAVMRERGLPLTERHFNALILGNSRSKDMAGCRSVLNNMTAADIVPGIETQSVILTAFLENETPEKAIEMLKEFHGQFNAPQLIRMLRSLLYNKKQPEAELIKHLIRELPKDFAEGIEVALPLRLLCIEFLYNGDISTVMHIIASLPTPHFNENQDIDTFGVFLLIELFRAKCDDTQILEVAKLLQESDKNTRALHIVTEVALRRDAATALPFLKSLSEQEALRPHYFWPLILQYQQQSGEAGLLNALKEMKSLNVICDHETIMQYILPNISLLLHRPQQAIKALDDAGLKPSLVLMYIIKHLLMHQRLAEAHDLLELYPTKFVVEELVSILANAAVNVRATKRYRQFTKLLSALAKKNENQKVDWVGQLLQSMVQEQIRLRSDLKALQRFVDEMTNFGLVISPGAARAIVMLLEDQSNKDASLASIKEALNKISDPSVMLLQNATISHQNSSFAKHPRNMSLEELECHLNELEGKGMNTRGVLRRLLQLCVRDGYLERALEVKAKCDKLRVQVSAGMLASTLDLYIKLKDLLNAEKTLERLQQEFPDFPIDEHKFIDYAALLVHEKQLEVAKNMLQLRAVKQKIFGGDYVIKNVWNFLTNVAKLAAQTPQLEPERNLTRENFHFLQKLRYCNAHNAVLGPIVRERLLRYDIKGAVTDFQTLAKQYKHTPLQFELLCLLVRLCNGHEPEVAQYGDVSEADAQQLLDNVTDSISKVHGSLNMNSGLLLAFAASGTNNQLRRLLINPEFRINDELLLKNCQHLGEEGAVETLLRLARGARGFGRVINEQNIYNMLLTHFAKANNYQAALDLYERLEADDDLKISQEFLSNLVHLLRVNKIEIPSRVALQAQIM
ncbi:leucine-rich PPR motif-containing protein, mitochondrial [Eurosta solidaginis]|uniref:leucine-rich PPR motif-containing protein, mitochondrial n=1 Tax=Eurosta solidaginis TaxID=178769 RepID=UPI003530DAE7